MKLKSLYRRIRKLIASDPQPLKLATTKRRPKAKPRLKNCLHIVKDVAKHGIVEGKADALVEMARDMAGAILAHPEKYMTHVMGTEALVVDDATYEALFYLFSGKTRERLFSEDAKVYAITLHCYTIISKSLLAEARAVEGDHGHGF